MTDLASFYLWRFTFCPPGGTPITSTLSLPELHVLLSEIQRQRPKAKPGRRLDSRSIRLRNLLKAREVLHNHSCSGPQTVARGLANKRHFRPTFGANRPACEPTIPANEPRLIATSLQTAL